MKPKIDEMDVPMVYLHCDIDDELCMGAHTRLEVVLEYIIRNEQRDSPIRRRASLCRLHKAIYEIEVIW